MSDQQQVQQPPVQQQSQPPVGNPQGSQPPAGQGGGQPPVSNPPVQNPVNQNNQSIQTPADEVNFDLDFDLTQDTNKDAGTPSTPPTPSTPQTPPADSTANVGGDATNNTSPSTDDVGEVNFDLDFDLDGNNGATDTVSAPTSEESSIPATPTPPVEIQQKPISTPEIPTSTDQVPATPSSQSFDEVPVAPVNQGQTTQVATPNIEQVNLNPSPTPEIATDPISEPMPEQVPNVTPESVSEPVSEPVSAQTTTVEPTPMSPEPTISSAPSLDTLEDVYQAVYDKVSQLIDATNATGSYTLQGTGDHANDQYTFTVGASGLSITKTEDGIPETLSANMDDDRLTVLFEDTVILSDQDNDPEVREMLKDKYTAFDEMLADSLSKVQQVNQKAEILEKVESF